MIKQKIFFSAFIVLLPLNVCAIDTIIPSGWRVPAGKERIEIWGPQGKAIYHVVKEDFNNDGILDEARLLRKENGQELGFFLFLSEGDSHKAFLLEKWDESKWLIRIGVAPVKPGRYVTAYGKGYSGDYGPNEPEEIVLEYPGVNLFLSESANRYYYYNKTKKTIEWIQISD